MTAPSYDLVSDLGQLEQLVAKMLADAKPFGFDIETGYDGEPREKAQLHPEEGIIVGFSLTNSVSWARYIPLRHDSGPNVDNTRAAELLWPLMRTGLGVAHNAKFELRFLSRWFVQYLGTHPDFGPAVQASRGYFPVRSDTMLEMHAEGRSKSLALKESTLATFNRKMMTLEELFALCSDGKPLTKRQQDSMRFNTLDLTGEHRQDIVDYACEDALWALAHHAHAVKGRYARVKGTPIYRLEMAILPVCCAMEDEGVLCDWSFFREGSIRAMLFREKLQAEIQADLSALLSARGIAETGTINLASPPQVAKVLYEQLGLPSKRKSRKTGNPSTDKIALKGLSKDHAVVQKLLNWKSLTKLNGTYLAVYEGRYSYAPDGRTHPNIMQTAVGSGRFAVSDWPYQQSPKKYYYALASPCQDCRDWGELGTCCSFRFSFRDGVKAPEGWYQLGFDYSQIELRVMAGEAGETALIEAFRAGEDVHRKTAALMLGKPLSEITDADRAVGKTMNFALGYQMGPDGLADRLAVTKDQAQDLFDQYFAVYSRIKAYMERTISAAKRDGYVSTRLGRRVPIWGFDTSVMDYAYRDAERLAGNAPIQGGAADYMKVSMVRASKALAEAGLADKVRLVMNIHDALEFYVHRSVTPLTVIRALQPAVVWSSPAIAHWPPMVADWHAGLRWGSVRDLDVPLSSSGYPLSVSVRQARQVVPVTEMSGDEDGELPVAVDAGVVQALVGQPEPAAVASEPAGAAAGVGGVGPAFPGSSGGGNGAGGLSPHTVIVDVQEMPSREAAGRLMAALHAQPGANTVFLRAPGGESVQLASGCGLSPAQAPEVSLLLGVGASVTYQPGAELDALADGIAV